MPPKTIAEALLGYYQDEYRPRERVDRLFAREISSAVAERVHDAFARAFFGLGFDSGAGRPRGQCRAAAEEALGGSYSFARVDLIAPRETAALIEAANALLRALIPEAEMALARLRAEAGQAPDQPNTAQAEAGQ